MFDEKKLLEERIAELKAIIEKYKEEALNLNENKVDINYNETRRKNAEEELEKLQITTKTI